MKNFNRKKLNYVSTLNVNGEKAEAYRYGSIDIFVSDIRDYVRGNDYVVISFEKPIGKVDGRLIKEIAGYFGLNLNECFDIRRNVIYGCRAA